VRANSGNTIIRHLRRAVLFHEGAGLTDGQLLAAFINRKDETAFEAMVRRHGPMVLNVCRRVLRNAHDADDAFQATFLVLVRKAGSIGLPELLANWLYGVAYNTARKARAAASKRRQREKPMATIPEPLMTEPALWQDLQPLLDQELSRLPEKYRVPIILCHLEGKSIKDAARHLNWPQGTLAGRLARARAMLAKRLARHGQAILGGALAAALAQNVSSACVPNSLVSATVKAASALAAGQAAAQAVISANVAALTEGVLKAMFMSKLRTVTMVLMISALVGGAGLFCGTQAAEQGKQGPTGNGSATAREAALPDREAEPALAELSGTNALPSGPMPWQALVSLDKGKLAVRTLSVYYEPITVAAGGKTRTSYQKAEILKTMHYDTEMVKVYDVKGKRISTKNLAELLKKETVALAATDAQAAEPLNLRLFKEGTLLFILPPSLAQCYRAPPSGRGPDNSTSRRHSASTLLARQIILISVHDSAAL